MTTWADDRRPIGDRLGPVKALITNDDGPENSGSSYLARGLRLHGWSVTEVYPSVNCSGIGSSINTWPQTEQQRSSMSATLRNWTPSLIVQAHMDAPPEDAPTVVITGPNLGPNVGVGILHSGTVMAAMSASVRGAIGIALSVDDRYSTGGSEDGPIDWQVVTHHSILAIRICLSQPDPSLFNVNIPNLPASDVREPHFVGVSSVSKLIARGPLSAVPSSIVLPTFDARADGRFPDEIESLTKGHVTISRLQSPFKTQKEFRSNV